MTIRDLPNAEDTDALGARLAQTLPPKAVVHLHGDLGAGKSTLARALLRSLGVSGTIRSPTYTLVEHYPFGNGDWALHLDLYRIGSPEELEYLGLDLEEVRLWLVEWPARGGDAMPRPDLEIQLSVEGTGRRCVLRPCSPIGEAWLRALAAGEEMLTDG